MEGSTGGKKPGRPRTRPVTERNKPYQSVGRRGVPLRSQARELVCLVRQFFVCEKNNNGPLLPVDKVIERTAAALKIGKNTVVKICNEKMRKVRVGGSHALETPRKKREHKSRVTGLDAFQIDAIRRHVYGYFTRKEYPTLKKLLVSLHNDTIFEGSKSSLLKVMKKIGFRYKKINGRKLLLERNDIVAKRCRFLREIVKKNFDDVVWLDETWVNANHAPQKTWTDRSLKSTMPVPVGKGGRVILLHAGSSKGFVDGCCLLFTSKKTGDYHEEMNHETFYGWFKNSLLPNLKNSSVIVMDNAPYHSKILNKTPTVSNNKEDIKNWLRKQNINFDESMHKAELMELVNIHKPAFPKYIIDELAREAGHQVIRLPPYHCHYNSIELIWAQVKDFVAKNNKCFTITEVTSLTKDAIINITPDKWKAVVEHTKTVIEEEFKKEGILEEAVESLIININGDSSEDDTTDEETIAEDSEEELYDYDVHVFEEDAGECDMSGIETLSPLRPNEKVLDFEEY